MNQTLSVSTGYPAVNSAQPSAMNATRFRKARKNYVFLYVDLLSLSVILSVILVLLRHHGTADLLWWVCWIYLCFADKILTQNIL